MAATKKKTVKTNKKTAKRPAGSAKPDAPKRVIEKPKYKTLRLSKRIKHENKPIMGSFRLMKASIQHLLGHKRLFFGIAAIYFLLSMVLVYGAGGGTDFIEIKDILETLFEDGGGQLLTAITLAGVLVTGGSQSISESGAVYQTILMVVISLTVIWALRQTYAKVKTTIKTSFYKSMTPLVPFLMIILVIGLQCLPFVAATSLYQLVVTQGVAVTALERILWGMMMVSLMLLTLYMVSSSVFALYIVTLPDLTPMKALRSARELVRYRRWSIMRKVLFLPFALLALGFIIMMPILFYVTIIAQFMYTFLTMLALVVAHSYIYRLYRELL